MHPEALYEPLFLLAEAPAEEEGWRLRERPGTAGWAMLAAVLVADEAQRPDIAGAWAWRSSNWRVRENGDPARCPPASPAGPARPARRLSRRGAWRWHDDFTERFPKVIATNHLFEWDRDRMTACGGMAVLDLLLALLSRDHGAELAGAVSRKSWWWSAFAKATSASASR